MYFITEKRMNFYISHTSHLEDFDIPCGSQFHHKNNFVLIFDVIALSVLIEWVHPTYESEIAG